MRKEDLVRGIAYALDGNGMRHFLNVKTGVINTFSVYDLHFEEGADPVSELFYGDDFVEIVPYTSDEAYSVMERFIDSLPEGAARSHLDDALSMRRPFDRFRSTLEYYSGMKQKWYRFKAEYFRDVAEEWIEYHGIDPEKIGREEVFPGMEKDEE